MAEPTTATAPKSFFEQHKDDLGKVCEALVLKDEKKTRAEKLLEGLTGVFAKWAEEGVVPGLAAIGFSATPAGVGGVAAGLAVKWLSAKFEDWLKANDATAAFTKKVAETQGEADRRLLLRDIRLWLEPTLHGIAGELAQHVAELTGDHQTLFDVVLRRLPDHPADSLVGLLTTRVSSLAPRVADRTPLQLIHARYAVVPFDESVRADELQALRMFCESEELEPLEVQLFIGAGGAGKTRLLIQFCEELWGRTDVHWHAGFLPPARRQEAIHALARPGHPALVVIDYAEGWPGLADWLKQLADADRARSRIRVVLLARHADEWWPHLAQGEPLIAHLQRHPVVALNDVSYDSGSRARFYRDASAAFSRALNRPVSAPEAPALKDFRYARPLYLQMAALMHVLDSSMSLVDAAADLPWELVLREAKLWRSGNGPVDWSLMRLMAGVTLLGGANLETLEVLTSVSKCSCEEGLVGRLMAYYPRVDGVAPLEPDILGEALVLHALQHRETPAKFLDAVLVGRSDQQIQWALTVLGRIATEHAAQARAWIDRALRADLLGRARPAFEATLAVSEQHVDDVLGRSLASALQGHADVSLAREWAARLPNKTVALREIAVWVWGLLVNEADSDEERAGCAVALGNVLSDVGDREGALRATLEAVDDYRKLAASRPEAFLSGLSMSLTSLGKMLSDVGDRDGALHATREAVDGYRKLAASRPDAFLPDLVGSLNNLGMMLGNVGDRDGALQATREAVDGYRKLAASRPEAFLPGLAMSLNNLGNRLSDVGDRDGALQAIREAVDGYRKLAASQPEAFLPGVAMSLNNLGKMLSDVGDRDGALHATREAVDIRRKLAASRPEAFLPDLVGSLTNLGMRLSNVGDRDGALQATREAVDGFRKLAASRPDAFLPGLAMSLNNLGRMLSGVGEREGALQATREAVDIRRKLVERWPHLKAELDSSLRFLAELDQS